MKRFGTLLNNYYFGAVAIVIIGGCRDSSLLNPDQSKFQGLYIPVTADNIFRL